MEIFLLHTVALLRPIASMDVAGADLFDLTGTFLLALVVVAFLSDSAIRRTISISPVDLFIAAFSLWTVSIYIVYFEVATIRDVAKVVTPLISYVVVKNIIKKRYQYGVMMRCMIGGFSLAAFASVILIASGKGVDYVSYWTDITRWQGAYRGSHNFGHSMALFFMLIVWYAHFARRDSDGQLKKLTPIAVLGLTSLGTVAVWCLYMSQTRSAILGAIIFSVIYMLAFNKKLLLIGGAVLAIVASLTLPSWLPTLLPDLVLLERGTIDASELGSGRPKYWQHNLSLYADLPLDKKIAGVGIGNKAKTMDASKEEALDSHNDWLDLLIQTGFVGLVLYLMLQLLLIKVIVGLPKHERVPLLAIFIAVNVMMFVSNSYVYRIGVAQPYYMLLAFIESRWRRDVTK